MSQLQLGFEIECEYNNDRVSVCPGDYHEGEDLTDDGIWNAQRDSSLRGTRFSSRSTVEIVNNGVLTEATYEQALQSFKDYFSCNGRYELHEVLHFNLSCGAHIHFSLENYKPLYVYVPQKAEKILQQIVTRRISEAVEATILPTRVAKLFERQYYREYARPYDSNYRGREKCVSLHHHRGCETLEWRSFNLRGVRTWQEFFAMYHIAIETIKEFIEYMKKVGMETEDEIHVELPATRTLYGMYSAPARDRRIVAAILQTQGGE